MDPNAVRFSHRLIDLGAAECEFDLLSDMSHLPNVFRPVDYNISHSEATFETRALDRLHPEASVIRHYLPYISGAKSDFWWRSRIPVAC